MKRFTFLFLIFQLFVGLAMSQNTITGVVNNYYQVNSLNGTTGVYVSSTTGLTAGDTVLLMDMQGCTIVTTQTAIFGDIYDIQTAGNWEFLIVQSVNAGLVTFTCNITKSYLGKCQLIRVPSYNNVTATSGLTCSSWDGMNSTGGVLCFIVNNTLTIDNHIDVSGMGYRGGMPIPNPMGGCSSSNPVGYSHYYYPASSDSAGQKGEGIFNAQLSGTYLLGRGKIANGGGGGNSMNAAGGGGGNGGSGGKGGKEIDTCTSAADIGGIGGLSLSTYNAMGRIFMGGGGGSGTSEMFPSDPLPGGAGGGIVIIIANNIIGNSREIRAKGESIVGTTLSESAGGGGAGGTIVLFANTITGGLDLNVKGGDGGSASGGTTSSCRGSGGGGGGGFVLVRQGVTGIGTIYLDGGAAGLANCTSHKGINGSVGLAQYTASIPLPCPAAIVNTIQAPQQICSGSIPATLTGNVPTGGNGTVTAYLWSQSTDGGTIWLPCPMPNNQQNYTFSAGLTQTTKFRRHVLFSSSDNSFSNGIEITVSPSFNVNINGATSMCPYDSVTLFAVTDTMLTGYSYMWSNGSTADSLKIGPYILSGTYLFSVTVTNGICVDQDTFSLVVKNLPVFSITGTTQICSGETTTLTCSVPTYICFWSTSQWENSITVNPTTTTQYIAVASVNGCLWADTIIVLVPPKSVINSTINDTICPGAQAQVGINLTGTPPWSFNYSNGVDSWSAQNINNSPYTLAFTPPTAGNYSISSFIDGISCPGTINSGFEIIYKDQPDADAGVDTIVCGNTCTMNAHLETNETGIWTASFGVVVAFPANPHSPAGIGAPNNTYSLYWTVTGTEGCTDADTVLVRYNSEPSTPSAGDDQQLLQDNQTLLTATSPTSGFGTWYLIDGTGLIVDSLNPNTQVTGLSMGDNIFRWVVKNPPCPSKFDEVTISMQAVSIPTGFSPNLDLVNDVFIIEGLTLYPENQIDIYNRWGIMVFTAKPYLNDWDGRDWNNHVLPEDTYFYVLKLSQNEFIKGYVLIRR